MTTRTKKVILGLLIAVVVLVGLRFFFISRNTANTQHNNAETDLGIEGYSQLSRYAVTDGSDYINSALAGLLGEIQVTSSQQDQTGISIAGEHGSYDGWYTANSFAVYRMPSELPLEDNAQLQQQASDIIKQLGWETAELTFEQKTATLYCAVFQPQLNGVPLDGFRLSLWMDADGIQRIEATGYIHIVEKIQTYDLASMYSSEAVILQFDDVFSEDAQQRNRRLPRLGYPTLTYARSEEKPGQLILAWKLTFEESYKDSNGENARQSGYYLIDAEQLSVISRVEDDESTGLVLFREWETIVRCILGPEYAVDVAESTHTPDLTVTITGPDVSYTGSASQDKYLKFRRESIGAETTMPTDSEIKERAGELAEALGTVLLDEPQICRNSARTEVYFYLGSTQNNGVCLLYDTWGLLSAELLTGAVPQSEIPEGAIGSYVLPSAQVDESILMALQNGGLTFQCDVELPKTPVSIPSYTVESIATDCDTLLRTVFGQDCDYVLESNATGSHCMLETEAGVYAVSCSPKRFCVLRMEHSGEELSCDEEDIAELAEKITKIPNLNVFQGTYEKSYMLYDDTVQLLYQEKLDGIPISTHSYYLSGMEGSVKGTCLILTYDSYGLVKIELERPGKIISTGTDITGMLSAEEALELVTDSMEGSNMNAVQVIRSIQLVYLNPVNDGGEVFPAWEISYDFYTFGGTNDEIDVCAGEYVYLIDAISGTLYAYH